MSDPTKPEFTLVKELDEDGIVALYERLTGRKVTPQERAEVVEIMRKKKREQS
jgi:hypothetical protein